MSKLSVSIDPDAFHLTPLDVGNWKTGNNQTEQNEPVAVPLDGTPLDDAGESDPLDDLAEDLLDGAVAAPADNPGCASETGTSATMEDAERVSFGTLLNRAMAPYAQIMDDIHLLRNIYTLRAGCDNHANTVDRDFDALFIASNPSNLDIFNRLVRISHIYSVPMYDLFFTKIPYGEYRENKRFKAVAHTLQYVAHLLDRDPYVTDENLFERLAAYPPKRINLFGYMPPVRPTTKGSLNTGVLPETQPAKEQPKMEHKEENTNAMDIKVKLRICRPCDADSWENDNPDRSAPGFHWEDGSAEMCEKAEDLLRTKLDKNLPHVEELRACLKQVVEHPFKGHIMIKEDGARMAIDLF